MHLEVAIEAPHRRERPRRRAPGEAPALELAEKSAEAQPVHRVKSQSLP